MAKEKILLAIKNTKIFRWKGGDIFINFDTKPCSIVKNDHQNKTK
jgi:hypothetical protein